MREGKKSSLGKGVWATPPGVLQQPAHRLAPCPSNTHSQVFEQTHNPWPATNPGAARPHGRGPLPHFPRILHSLLTRLLQGREASFPRGGERWVVTVNGKKHRGNQQSREVKPEFCRQWPNKISNISTYANTQQTVQTRTGPLPTNPDMQPAMAGRQHRNSHRRGHSVFSVYSMCVKWNCFSILICRNSALEIPHRFPQYFRTFP